MLVVKLLGSDGQFYQNLRGLLYRSFPELADEIVFIFVPGDVTYLSNDLLDLTACLEVSASFETPLRRVRSIAAAVVGLVDVIAFYPDSGAYRFFKMGSEVPLDDADPKRPRRAKARANKAQGLTAEEEEKLKTVLGINSLDGLTGFTKGTMCALLGSSTEGKKFFRILSLAGYQFKNPNEETGNRAIRIATYDFSSWTKSRLFRYGLKVMGELADIEKDLQSVRGIGDKSCDEIRRILADLGLIPSK